MKLIFQNHLGTQVQLNEENGGEMHPSVLDALDPVELAWLQGQLGWTQQIANIYAAQRLRGY